MSKKILFRLILSLGILAVVLIFLGVNFVPRILALAPAGGSVSSNAIQTRHSYIDVKDPHALTVHLTYPGSDWIERHPVLLNVNYTGSDWIDRHPVSVVLNVNYAGSDWIDRHPANYYTNSD
jgi:hypothetical protein